MKIFKLMAVALVALVGLNSCSKDCDHDFIDVDHSADLVGTWTCLEAGYAEALVIKADGSALSTGVEDGEYWENVAGNIVVKNGIATMTFEDGDNFEGHIDVIAGMAFSIYNEDGERMTYNYCANDLADEVVGMWVSNNGPTDMENEIQIRTYEKDGIVTTTGVRTIDGNPEWMLNEECNYRVVGDLMFKKRSKEINGQLKVTHSAERFVYAPKATALGDVMNVFFYLPMGDSYLESTVAFLRINQSLNLAGKKYDYIKTFVTNVDGLDQDIDFMGYTFNFAKMDGTTIDQMLKALLFSVEFPSANKIKYSCRFSSGVQTVEAPIAVDGNKMTLKMSDVYPTAKDVDLYTFQDADCSQMHMYMPTYAFINFFGNMQVIMMSQLGQLDTNNAEAVKAVFDSIDEAVNTINVSFVMEKATKTL